MGSTLNTFDSQGRISSFVTTSDRVSTPDTTAFTTLTYGAHDLVISVVTHSDGNNDGMFDRITTSMNTWVHK